MTEEQLQEYYEKFPVVIKEKLKNGVFCFPEKTEFDYEPIEAYRMVTRTEKDTTPFGLKDMESYFELKKKPRAGNINISDPKYYAVSLFQEIDMLKLCLRFPTPNKKIAHGYVHKEGGPRLIGEKTHISWWLFDGADLSTFTIVENENEQTIMF